MRSINEEERAAKVIVPDNQLSLAIGIRGINAKLAARLTGWKIDIRSQTQAQELFDELAEQEQAERMAENEAALLEDIETTEDILDEIEEEEMLEDIALEEELVDSDE